MFFFSIFFLFFKMDLAKNTENFSSNDSSEMQQKHAKYAMHTKNYAKTLN